MPCVFSSPACWPATQARPLWWMCVGIGVAVTVLGFVSTSPRALRSAERLAPLIEGPREPEPAGVH